MIHGELGRYPLFINIKPFLSHNGQGPGWLNELGRWI
jgi:hypothetical protein